MTQHEKDAGVVYENIKDDILDSWDMFSFFGGYPNFFTFPMIPKCEKCKKNMNLWLQMDTQDDAGLYWGNGGCLHIFRCPEDNLFKIHI